MQRSAQKLQLISDHRELGEQMKIFSPLEEAPGMPLLGPNGVKLKNELISYWRQEHQREGYEEIESPLLLDKKVWEISGHWDHFKEHMFILEEAGRVFALRPVNCPGAILYYKQQNRSYKELPKRICELGRVHRNELSGSLMGLMRVRSFVQDDAHIFCQKEQLVEEVMNIISLARRMLGRCGFAEISFEVSVRSEAKKEKYLGSDQEWSFAEEALEKALGQLGVPYQRREGEAKFYGPSLDFHLKDHQGKNWQCSSIQVDFNLPRRFGVEFVNPQGKREVPYVLHRVVFGSLERFMGILLEHFAGHLPLWLAPEQVRVLPVKLDDVAYAQDVCSRLWQKNLRVGLDQRQDNLSMKIKEAQKEKVPLMIIVGEKERAQKLVSVRKISGEQFAPMGVEAFWYQFFLPSSGP